MSGRRWRSGRGVWTLLGLLLVAGLAAWNWSVDGPDSSDANERDAPDATVVDAEERPTAPPGRGQRTLIVATNANGDRVPGVEVWRSWINFEERLGVTDAAGELAADPSDWSFPSMISGTSSRFVPARALVTERVDEVILNLEPGRRCRGIVTNMRGDPIADAAVTLTMQRAELLPGRATTRVRTDSTGHFELNGVDRAFLGGVLHVVAPGYGDSSRLVEAADLDDVHVWMTRPCAVLVTARDVDGHEIAGVSLRLGGHPNWHELLRRDSSERKAVDGTTDAAGTFRFDDLPSGTFTLVGWHEKLGVRTIEVDVSEGQVSRPELRFAEPRVVPGLVRDASSRAPIGGAHIVVSPETGVFATGRAPPGAVVESSEERGEFEVVLQPDQATTVRCEAESYLGTSTRWTSEEGPDSFLFELAPYPSVDMRGRVITAADGAPIAGALVSWSGGSCVSNATGAFEAKGMFDGGWLSVEKDGFLRRSTLSRNTSEPVVVELIRAVLREVIVRDTDGVPVVRSHVGVRIDIDGEPYPYSRGYQVDRTGRAWIELAEGLDNEVGALVGGEKLGVTVFGDAGPTIELRAGARHGAVDLTIDHAGEASLRCAVVLRSFSSRGRALDIRSKRERIEEVAVGEYDVEVSVWESADGTSRRAFIGRNRVEVRAGETTTLKVSCVRSAEERGWVWVRRPGTDDDDRMCRGYMNLPGGQCVDMGRRDDALGMKTWLGDRVRIVLMDPATMKAAVIEHVVDRDEVWLEPSYAAAGTLAVPAAARMVEILDSSGVRVFSGQGPRDDPGFILPLGVYTVRWVDGGRLNEKRVRVE